MKCATPIGRLGALLVLAAATMVAPFALAQSLEVPDVPLDKVPEAQRAAAQRARTGKFGEFKKLSIARAEAGLKLQAFRKSLRGKEQTEADLAKVAKLNDDLSKAGDRMDDWAQGKEFTPEDHAAMDYINQEVTAAALEWGRKHKDD